MKFKLKESGATSNREKLAFGLWNGEGSSLNVRAEQVFVSLAYGRPFLNDITSRFSQYGGRENDQDGPDGCS